MSCLHPRSTVSSGESVFSSIIVKRSKDLSLHHFIYNGNNKKSKKASGRKGEREERRHQEIFLSHSISKCQFKISSFRGSWNYVRSVYRFGFRMSVPFFFFFLYIFLHLTTRMGELEQFVIYKDTVHPLHSLFLFLSLPLSLYSLIEGVKKTKLN